MYFDNKKMCFTLNLMFKVDEQFGGLQELLSGDTEAMMERGLWFGHAMMNEYIKKANYEYGDNDPLVDIKDFEELFLDALENDNLCGTNITHGLVEKMWELINSAISESIGEANNTKKSNIKFVDEDVKVLYKYLGLKVLNLSRRDLGYMTPDEISKMAAEHAYAMGDENAKKQYIQTDGDVPEPVKTKEQMTDAELQEAIDARRDMLTLAEQIYKPGHRLILKHQKVLNELESERDGR